jgi:GTP-binding protein HflX
MTDTVGFIQKLPTTLIAAFRATLEEILEADIILHVVDTSHPGVSAHIEAVEDILAEMDVPENLPRILVWNKIDRWGDQSLPYSPEAYTAQVKVSAETGDGLEDLLQVLEEISSTSLARMTLMIPYHRGEILSQLHDVARIIQTDSTEQGSLIEVEIPRHLVDRFEPYRLGEN